MGGAVSSGEDNEELIDNLIDAEYIKTPLVEKAFRAVDRGHYYLEGFRDAAYKDMAWKNGNLHLSAPCIYSEVLECLQLRPGLSFLNLGSGTGYLSTVAGLLLGSFGINHGVEQHADVVEYASERLAEFMKNLAAVDLMDFCCPSFVVGNCLQLEPSCSVQAYDRIYCGAAVPSEYLSYIRNLVKIGGIVVVPSGDQLLQITRVKEDSWETKSVLPVSFATLAEPSAEDKARGSAVLLPDRIPLRLQEICRATIRSVLRNKVQEENPDFVMRSVIPAAKGRRNNSDHRTNSGDSGDGHVESSAGRRRRRFVQRILIPVFRADSDDEDDDDDRVRLPPGQQGDDHDDDETQIENSNDGSLANADSDVRRADALRTMITIGTAGVGRNAGGFLRMGRLRWNRFYVPGISREPTVLEESNQLREEADEPTENNGHVDNTNGSANNQAPEEDIRDSLDFEQQLLLSGNTDTDGHGRTDNEMADRPNNGIEAPGHMDVETTLTNENSRQGDIGETDRDGNKLESTLNDQSVLSTIGDTSSGSASASVGESSKRCHSESEVPEVEARRKRAAASTSISPSQTWRSMMSDGDSDTSDVENEQQREQKRRSRQENVAMQKRFSETFKSKIFLLPVPDSLKAYLNFYRD